MGLVDTATVSFRSLNLIKALFELEKARQDLEQSKKDRTAKYLRKIADTVRRLDEKVRNRDLNVSGEVAKMRVHLRFFPENLDALASHKTKEQKLAKRVQQHTKTSMTFAMLEMEREDDDPVCAVW